MKPHKLSNMNIDKRVRWLEGWKPGIDHRMAWIWTAVIWALALGAVACFWNVVGFP